MSFKHTEKQPYKLVLLLHANYKTLQFVYIKRPILHFNWQSYSQKNMHDYLYTKTQI